MILRGILDRSLGSQTVIRGFAPIKELARISKADYKYQRNLIGKQEDDIKTFLETESHLFFPEVILSLKLKNNSNRKEIDPLTPIQQLDKNDKFACTTEKLNIHVKKTKIRKNSSEHIKNVELSFDENILDNLIKSDNHPFKRIDGNHRLSAASYSESPHVRDMNAPFCIILLNDSNTETDIFEKMVFHNINTKTVPLTSEENLKVILDDKKNFPDELLKDKFGAEYLLTRKVFSEVSGNIKDIYPNLGDMFWNNPRTFSKDVISILLKEEKIDGSNIKNIKKAIQKVNQKVGNYSELYNLNNIALVEASLFFQIAGYNLDLFLKWAISNHITGLTDLSAKSLIDIYQEIHKNIPKIFVAMPYFDGDSDIVKSYNEAYDQVIKNIKEKYEIELELFKIMTHSGGTKNIINEMIDQIEKCDIFIADISSANPNVAYELGYAKSRGTSIILIKKENDEIKTPFDYLQDVCHPYKCGALTTLKDVIEENILTVLKEKNIIHE